MLARMWSDPSGTAADICFLVAAILAVTAIALRFAGRTFDPILSTAAVAALALGLLAR